MTQEIKNPIRYNHDRTHSDGMCGKVALFDVRTGCTAQVHWSVSAPRIRDGHTAYKVAWTQLELLWADGPWADADRAPIHKLFAGTKWSTL